MEKMQAQLEAMMNNKVNIEFMQKQIEKLQSQVEKLQEEHRTFKAQNGKSY
jgi:predicted ATP-grasp superfamily ATP-dependent carboligase